MIRRLIKESNFIDYIGDKLSEVYDKSAWGSLGSPRIFTDGKNWYAQWAKNPIEDFNDKQIGQYQIHKWNGKEWIVESKKDNGKYVKEEIKCRIGKYEIVKNRNMIQVRQWNSTFGGGYYTPWEFTMEEFENFQILVNKF